MYSVNKMPSRSRTVVLAISIICAYIVWGALISLQPPFYPTEAEKKGATPSQVKPLCKNNKYYCSVLFLGKNLIDFLFTFLRPYNSMDSFLELPIWLHFFLLLCSEYKERE